MKKMEGKEFLKVNSVGTIMLDMPVYVPVGDQKRVPNGLALVKLEHEINMYMRLQTEEIRLQAKQIENLRRQLSDIRSVILRGEYIS